eukprot:TRINITY_DN5654_c0_g2_i2.p1 TRINITY_DN5654_c0_g2~~TRINITY_DN5654_c0_g2_i2.p1  ORF type:complete len:770 (+),score=203.91 TRINITY_DN5654_c0_g2_i2:167-2476(+)
MSALEDSPRRMSTGVELLQKRGSISGGTNRSSSPKVTKIGQQEFSLNALLTVGVDFSALTNLLQTMAGKVSEQDGAMEVLKRELADLRERDYERNNAIHGLKKQIEEQSDIIGSQKETIIALTESEKILRERVSGLESRVGDLSAGPPSTSAPAAMEETSGNKEAATPPPPTTSGDGDGGSGDVQVALQTLELRVNNLDQNFLSLSRNVEGLNRHARSRAQTPDEHGDLSGVPLGALGDQTIPLDLGDGPSLIQNPQVSAVESNSLVLHEHYQETDNHAVEKGTSPHPQRQRSATPSQQNAHSLVNALREEMHALDNVRSNAFNSLVAEVQELRGLIEDATEGRKRRPPKPRSRASMNDVQVGEDDVAEPSQTAEPTPPRAPSRQPSRQSHRGVDSELCDDNATRIDDHHVMIEHLKSRVHELEKFEFSKLIPGLMHRLSKIEAVLVTLEKDRQSMQQLHTDIKDIFAMLPKSGFTEETEKMLKEHANKLENLFTSKADIDTVERILRTTESHENVTASYVDDLFARFEAGILSEVQKEGHEKHEEMAATLSKLRGSLVRKADKAHVRFLEERLDEFDTDDAAGMKRQLKPDRCISCDRALPSGVGIQNPTISAGLLHIGTVPAAEKMPITPGRRGSPGAKVAYNRSSYRDPESTPRLVNVNFRSPFTPSAADMQHLPYLSQSDRFTPPASAQGGRSSARSSPRNSRPQTRDGTSGAGHARGGAPTDKHGGAGRPVTAPDTSGKSGLPPAPRSGLSSGTGSKRPSPPPR